MSTLFLLRHAKSIPGGAGLRDFDRMLSDQGRRQAERVGKYLKEHQVNFDLVLSSTALRARETTEIGLATAGSSAEVRYDDRIYEASQQQLLQVISEIEPEKATVLLVGHNPGFEELLHRLTDRFPSMATATLAKVVLRAQEWSHATERGGKLDWLVKPDEL
ncbi:MAG TPA: histidine phosphatase family protein [Pyrinomonadaceae bacterium]|nr:histidine phosphatase family protein [Pyrinomonadaceae bacterium]